MLIGPCLIFSFSKSILREKGDQQQSFVHLSHVPGLLMNTVNRGLDRFRIDGLPPGIALYLMLHYANLFIS